MASHAYDIQMLIKLESGSILPGALPTRIWTGPGPIDLDIGDGSGSVRWTGTSFANTETQGIVNLEKTSEGFPKRLTVAIAVDGSRDDIRSAVVGADHGPLTTTLIFLARPTAGESLPQYQFGAIQIPNRDPEPTLSLPGSGVRDFIFIGNNTFRFALPVGDREAVRDLLIEGNEIRYGSRSSMTVVYATVASGTTFDVWTVQVEDSDRFGEDNDFAYNFRFVDPPKDQDWSFIVDDAGAPLVIRGRTGEMSYARGLWSFDINNRIHDADRQVVDIWSDSIQQSKYPGDTFFQRCQSIEAGLDFSWPD